MNKQQLLILWVLSVIQLSIFAQPVITDQLEYVFKSGDDGYATFRIPAIVTAKSGKLLAFAEGRVGNSSDNGNIDLVMKSSVDGGKTWSALKIIWNDAENACQNPAPVVDQNTGNIFLLMTLKLGTDKEPEIIDQKSKATIRVFVTSTENEGETWTSPQEITSDVMLPNWTWYATGPCHGIQLHSEKFRGRLVVPCDHIEAGSKKYYSHVIYSDDSGKNWKLGGTTPQDQVNECTVAELTDGRLILNMRNYDRTEKTRKISFSSNGGLTWSDIKHDSTLIEPICQASLIYSDETAKLYFLNPAHTRSRENLTLRSSADNGKTWKTETVLFSGPAAYSDMTILKNGNLGCLFEAGNSNPYEGIAIREVDLMKESFANPVWDGADPWMIKQGDDYIYCFTQKNAIYVSKSGRMTKMGETRQVWKAPETGWNRTCVWAPEIHFIDGRWYVYYAAGKSGPPFIHQRTGVLRSKTADVFSEYEDLGMLYTGDDSNVPESNIWAIDMTVFEHNRKLYAVWSGWEKQADTDKTPQNLYIQEMENPFTMKGIRVLLSSPEESWETGGPLNINEGPEVLENDDKVFIVYSCRESWTPEYRLGMLQLKSKRANPLSRKNWIKTGPVFEGNEKVFGVGHCSFVKSPDETEDWIIYHSKKLTKPGWERDVRMQPFTWKPDGTPDFGKAIPAGVPVKLPSGEEK